MPKEYKYSVALFGNYDGTIAEFENVFPTYNHKITQTDIKKLLDIQNNEELDQKWYSAIPTLLSVSGDYVYNVLYEEKFPDTTAKCQGRILILLDHKITIKTIRKDYEYFHECVILAQGSNKDYHREIVVLSHQEIPDE